MLGVVHAREEKRFYYIELTLSVSHFEIFSRRRNWGLIYAGI